MDKWRQTSILIFFFSLNCLDVIQTFKSNQPEWNRAIIHPFTGIHFAWEEKIDVSLFHNLIICHLLHLLSVWSYSPNGINVFSKNFFTKVGLMKKLPKWTVLKDFPNGFVNCRTTSSPKSVLNCDLCSSPKYISIW